MDKEFPIRPFETEKVGYLTNIVRLLQKISVWSARSICIPTRWTKNVAKWTEPLAAVWQRTKFKQNNLAREQLKLLLAETCNHIKL